MRNYRTLFMLLALGFILLPNAMQAFQDGSNFFDQIGFDNDVEDVPESPIQGLLALGMIIGSYLGYRKLKK